MKTKATQFKSTKNIASFSFHEKFPTEETANSYLVQLRWRGKITCPYCQSHDISNPDIPEPYQCETCEQYFSVRTNTILANSNISLKTFLHAIYLMTAQNEGVTVTQLAEELGITYESAWLLGHRITHAQQQGSGLYSEPFMIAKIELKDHQQNNRRKSDLSSGNRAVGRATPVEINLYPSGKAQPLVMQKETKEKLGLLIHESILPVMDA